MTWLHQECKYGLWCLIILMCYGWSPRCWKISGRASLSRGQRCGEVRLMKDKYCSVFICRCNKQVGRDCERTLAAFLCCHQTTLKCSSLPSWLCFYCCPECAHFQWLGWREKAMCTHLTHSISHLHVLFVVMCTPPNSASHLPPAQEQKPASCFSLASSNPQKQGHPGN